ncbi:hypothetical protein DOY81_001300, partial [Sarcophaga bullata]
AAFKKNYKNGTQRKKRGKQIPQENIIKIKSRKRKKNRIEKVNGITASAGEQKKGFLISICKLQSTENRIILDYSLSKTTKQNKNQEIKRKTIKSDKKKRNKLKFKVEILEKNSFFFLCDIFSLRKCYQCFNCCNSAKICSIRTTNKAFKNFKFRYNHTEKITKKKLNKKENHSVMCGLKNLFVEAAASTKSSIGLRTLQQFYEEEKFILSTIIL